MGGYSTINWMKRMEYAIERIAGAVPVKTGTWWNGLCKLTVNLPTWTCFIHACVVCILELCPVGNHAQALSLICQNNSLHTYINYIPSRPVSLHQAFAAVDSVRVCMCVPHDDANVVSSCTEVLQRAFGTDSLFWVRKGAKRDRESCMQRIAQ